MNNSGSIYVAHEDREAVAAALRDYMHAHGFSECARVPGQISGRIMIPDKRARLFFLIAPSDGWITVWEDPRYFGDRMLARHLAHSLNTQAIWIEVSGNAVGWCYGVYDGDQALDEVYEPLNTTFYGEYGTIYFAFNAELSADEFIARHSLPYDTLHYEAVIDGELPLEAGEPIHLSFEKAGR